MPGKLDHAPSGRVTKEEIDYCRQDVRATLALLNALLVEFRKYPLRNLQPEKAFSAASIAKAFLDTMGVVPPGQKFKIDDATLGNCMQGYYGGRAEIRIRHTPVPVVYTDFTSQYPTANTLLRLWPLLTAEKLRIREATREVRSLLKGLDFQQLLKAEHLAKAEFFRSGAAAGGHPARPDGLRAGTDWGSDQHRPEPAYFTEARLVRGPRPRRVVTIDRQGAENHSGHPL